MHIELIKSAYKSSRERGEAISKEVVEFICEEVFSLTSKLATAEKKVMELQGAGQLLLEDACPKEPSGMNSHLLEIKRLKAEIAVYRSTLKLFRAASPDVIADVLAHPTRHECGEWDSLSIEAQDPEFESCQCDFEG